YRELDVDGRQFIFPTTTPTQFEPEAMRASIVRLLGRKPECLYLTHYSRVHDVDALGRELLRRLDACVAIGLGHREAMPERHARIKGELSNYLLAEARTFGCQLPEQTLLDIWKTDLELNAQGLEVWLDSITQG
ncbi:MAG TPA: MBL fold metallo-hydrolase, partial [Rhodocyclaceae bacterium]|nr:MBL fold metallo-hydrolase [Rhodocyclaceae bacterium]